MKTLLHPLRQLVCNLRALVLCPAPYGPIAFPLRAGTTHRIEGRGRHLRLEVRRGNVWMTHALQPADFVLRAGMPWEGKADGLVVIEALDDAFVDLRDVTPCRTCRMPEGLNPAAAPRLAATR